MVQVRFPAFYRCSKCGKIAGGMISSRKLHLRLADGGRIVADARKIKIISKLDIFCVECRRFTKKANLLSGFCHRNECRKEIKFYYYPSLVGIFCDGEKHLIKAESLLADHLQFGFCSPTCAKKKRQRGITLYTSLQR